MRPRLPVLATALVGLTLAAAPASGQRADHARVATATGEAGAVAIPAGRYVPLYAAEGEADGIAVGAFRLDRRPVTVAEYLAFVTAEQGWQRGAAPEVLVGAGYLSGWQSPVDPGPAHPGDRPVTRVSWFAARAYCRWRGARLPTTDEWEYVAQASETRTNAFQDRDFNRRVLALIQNRPREDDLPPAGSTDRNAFGVRDLHGLVWEWTSDFNNQMLTGAGRDDRGLDRQRFCAAGSLGTTDLTNYAAFLRWAYRAGLDGTTSASTLGFRCAR